MTPLRAHHVARYRDLALLLVRHARLDALPDHVGSTPNDQDASLRDDAETLARELESMGPSFVKLGQLLSTRSDFLPSAYLDALSRLQDDVQPVPYSEIARTIEEELGIRISKAFASFEQTPLASASLGQVHRASLRDGRAVAVKVQRAGVRAQVVDDMEVMEELAEFADAHTGRGRMFGFSDIVKEFRRSIMDELDYELEAANLRLVGRQLSPYDHLVVPQPVDSYTTNRVLTMDLVRGRNVSSLGPLGRMEIDGPLLLEQLFDAYLDQILLEGLVHADPHPGNVLLTDDGRLALVDLGMVVRVSPELQSALLRLLLALSENDGREAAALMASLGEPRDGWDSERFGHEVEDMVRDHQRATVGDVEAGKVIAELARIAVSCGLRPPSELTMLGKTLLNLDQVATLLDPSFEPNQAISDHVGTILRRTSIDELSPGHVLTMALDAKEFAERLPGQVTRVLEALAEGKFSISIQGLNEVELMRNSQKLANRLAAGLVISSLLIGAAVIMRVDAKQKIFGYPAIALGCFLGAGVAGVAVIADSLIHDLPQHRRREHRRSGRL